MADETPACSLTWGKEKGSKGRACAGTEANGSSAATLVVLRSRGESPLIITAPCGKITTKGTCSRFGLDPVRLTFGPEGKQQTPMVRSNLKRRPTSPLEDVAKHLVDRSARKRQFSGPVTPMNARGIFTANWLDEGEPFNSKGEGNVPLPLCSPALVEKDRWSLVPVSSAQQQRFPPTPSTRSKIACTSKSARKIMACRQLKLRESQELQEMLKAQVLQGLAMERRETTYKAWLNSLLVPSSAGKVLDLDELFMSAASGVYRGEPKESVEKSEATAATASEKPEKLPSVKCRIAHRKVVAGRKGKEKSHSANLDAHLQSICGTPELRRRLGLGPLDLSKQQEIVSTMLQLAKHVDDGRLRMKQGCPLIADIALRERALKVLMSYSPAWLRLGLFVVLGPNVLHTLGVGASDAYTEVFLERHFLGDVCLAKTYATNKSIEGLYRDGYHDSLGKLILKRVLLLVLYLDRLKCQTALQIAHKVDGLDGGSPPLFRANCAVKSSRQAICDIFSNSLHGEGNFLGHLGTLGYHVSFVQIPLVEYNFKVIDVVADLHDGVRLCRVAQLLSNDPVPVHKMQLSHRTSAKLENCKVALKGLAEAGVFMDDREGCMVTPQDILSGVREKTLSLLWNIVLNLQLPASINSQKLWEEILRIQSLKGLARGQGFSPRSLSQLGLLLCWVETICSSYSLAVTDFGASFADGRALCYVLNFYLPEKLPLHEVHDSSSVEVIVPQLEFADTPGCDHGDELSITLCRGAAAQNFRLLKAVAHKFISIPKDLFGEETSEGDACIHEHGVIIFLTFLCSELLSHESLTRVQELAGTASIWEAELDSERTARLQELDRCHAVWAATKIQAWYRSAKQTSVFKGMRAKVVRIQRTVRDWLERKHAASLLRQEGEQTSVLQLERKVIIIQACYRGWMQRRRFTCLLTHVHDMQRTWRAKVSHNKFLRMRSAALKIQRAWRAYSANSASLRNTINSLVRLQAWWRGVLVRIPVRRLVSAVTIISRNYRAYVQRRFYRNLRTSVVRLQALARGKLARRKFSAYQDAALRIQRCFRCWVKKQKRAAEVLQVEMDSASRIQQAWRTHRSRLLGVKAAVKIQNAYKGHVQRKVYLECRARIIKLQSVVRMQVTRRQFLNYRYGAQKIQRAFRQWIVRRMSVRTVSAIVIQCAWRGYWSRKRQFQAALVIQRVFRAWSHSKRTVAALKLQAGFRGFRTRYYVRMWERAALVIQRHFRLYVARVKQKKLERIAATKIQMCWRGYVARECLIKAGMMCKRNTEYTLDTKAGMKALQIIRAAIQMRQQRKWFILHRSSAVRIQKWWRSRLTAKLKAVVNIQRHFRGWIAWLSYRRFRRSVILLQAHWRGYQHRRLKNLTSFQMLELRARMRVTAENVNNSMRLGNRLTEALANLLSKRTVSSILNTCATIDYATQHSELCCERLAQGGAVVKLLQLIQTTNRSPPHELVLKHALSILGNLARFPGIAQQLAESTQFMTIMTEQLHMFRHKDEVFRSAWHAFRLVCTVPVGADLLQRSPSIFRRLHLVAQNMEKKVDVEKRNLERLPSTAPSMTRVLLEKRLKEVTCQYHALVSLLNDVRKETEKREWLPVKADRQVKDNPTKGLQRCHFSTGQRTRGNFTERVPLMDRSNFSSASGRK